MVLASFKNVFFIYLIRFLKESNSIIQHIKHISVCVQNSLITFFYMVTFLVWRKCGGKVLKRKYKIMKL